MGCGRNIIYYPLTKRRNTYINNFRFCTFRYNFCWFGLDKMIFILKLKGLEQQSPKKSKSLNFSSIFKGQSSDFAALSIILRINAFKRFHMLSKLIFLRKQLFEHTVLALSYSPNLYKVFTMKQKSPDLIPNLKIVLFIMMFVLYQFFE